MGCFYLFKEKFKSKGQPKSTTTSAPIISFNSNNGTSRSDDSLVVNQTSKSSGSASSVLSIPALYEGKGRNLRVFEYNELRDATNGFNRLLKIGEGGFGSVYKGMVKPPNGKGDNIIVAVKKLNQNGLQLLLTFIDKANYKIQKQLQKINRDPSSEMFHAKIEKGHKQWLAEVLFLGVVEHPNLVKLIGYCAVDGARGVKRLLVYEFMPNKTLEDHLFNQAYPCLPWNLRLQIALGAAEGLAYLHEGLEVQVIYRDFKASNVLLDEEFNSKLSDFGLAREGPAAGNTHVSTAVMGTYGYAAPDYIKTGHLTDKSDVWSFGVVLYEILTGRRSIERNRPRNEQKLLDWVKHYSVESKRFSTIIDPKLENQYSTRAAKDIAKLANSCLSKKAKDRPKIREIVESIKQTMQFKEMDGCVEPGEENYTASDSEKKETGDTKSTRRRMLHLAKLRESANVIGRRRFMMMKVVDPM